MKPVKSEFSQQKDGEKFIAAAIIDENAISSLLYELATIEESLSLRDLFKMHSMFEMALDYLEVDTVEDVLP